MNDYDPNDISKRLIEAGNEWVEKNYAAELLEETKTTLLSQLKSKYLAEVGSDNKAETLAKADTEYIDHLKSMVAARRDANYSKVRYDTGKVYCELLRTRESTRRAEMNMR